MNNLADAIAWEVMHQGDRSKVSSPEYRNMWLSCQHLLPWSIRNAARARGLVS